MFTLVKIEPHPLCEEKNMEILSYCRAKTIESEVMSHVNEIDLKVN